MNDDHDNLRTPVARAAENGGVIPNRWRQLRAFTDARIGLGRAGVSLPTDRMLAFQLAHAQAIDAVHRAFDIEAWCSALAESGIDGPLGQAPTRLHSQADDRTIYLQRPDLGRLLNEASRTALSETQHSTQQPFDLAVTVVDGLSARAVHDHAVTFLEALSEVLADSDHDWRIAPLTLVEQGRVAIGDDIAPRLNAKAVLVLIGERPGLSSPDSLGLYLTWAPGRDTSDADRNCISNVRPAGLTPQRAAQRLVYLLDEAKRLGLTGVGLKDRSDDGVIENDDAGTRNFLTG
ncbi:ethanolamine ammonia-lyase subunit EutC [Salinisphaera sp. SPP-AMP-43]|uniref:ethanolamine ammonia-lyase subunit EutC n=1 Tax=Salinisphaera sp. SPP-AMP-43 TaxID=3121288 RepID=UPI003C6E281F